MPLAITSRVQRNLKRAWTTRVPPLQPTSPASLAAIILHRLLERSPEACRGDPGRPTIVVDFCSGAGGPVPSIAHELNSRLAAAGSGSVQFLLTDLRPNLASWRHAQEESGGVVGFMEDPVDATLPLLHRLAGFGRGEFGQRKRRLFGLYCLAFHHFRDDAAKAVLRRAIETFDGFAIIELQDRRLSSLILMVVNLFFVLISSVVFFWHDPVHLLLTYVIPVLPAIMLFDGCVSSLRTREFTEVMALVDDVLGTSTADKEVDYDEANRTCGARRGEWRFQGGRSRHTIPFGYINWVTAHRVETSES